MQDVRMSCCCMNAGTLVSSKAAYSPALPDDLGAPMEVIDIDAPMCGQDCFGNETCMSFAYDAAKGKCMKYGGNYFRNFYKTSGNEQRKDLPLTAQPMYFFNLSHALDRNYILDRDAGLCYKIYSKQMDHEEAEAVCSRDNARLLAVQTMIQLNAVLTYIQSESRDSFPLHVAGSGAEMTYFDAQPISDALFSTDGLSASGNCTQLTVSGLSKGSCKDTLFVACAY
ncbi:uncharacterized protein LOC110457676 [Mizuhopecten yessoensis]|uniref:uncharacterized protein LOC110457676 n=1 Tax=Mizuhopecten yessoensis TaxID=6573 RepID=UPI000B45CBA7|nr:uncharacterized protein LOC110457676 [Mizuhopecten yessoensis]